MSNVHACDYAAHAVVALTHTGDGNKPSKKHHVHLTKQRLSSPNPPHMVQLQLLGVEHERILQSGQHHVAACRIRADDLSGEQGAGPKP